MAGLMDKGFNKLRANNAPAQIAKATPPAIKRENIIGKRTTWAVQVGAFAKAVQARTAAEKALKKAGKYLQHGRVNIVPLKKRNGRLLHRARIVGISKRDAYRTCRLIKDCMELRAKLPPELAEVRN